MIDLRNLLSSPEDRRTGARCLLESAPVLTVKMRTHCEFTDQQASPPIPIPFLRFDSSHFKIRVLTPHLPRPIIWTNGNMNLRPHTAHLHANATPAELELSYADISWLNRFANRLAQEQGIPGSYFVGTFSTSAAEAYRDVCPMSVMFRCVWPPGTMSRHAFIRMLPETQNRDLGRAIDLAIDLVDKGGAVKRTESVWGRCAISLCFCLPDMEFPTELNGVKG